MTLPRVLLVSLGGTITMTPGTGGGITPTLTGADLVAAVPALGDVARIEAVSPFRLPGASLTLPHLRDVARLLDERLADDDLSGAIVVQGTDTIEETAFVLDLLVGGDKPVVVTGAMRGAGAPGADGPANLLAAAIVASSAEARGLGTLVVLNDTIHAAARVQKASTHLPSAFESTGSGPVGYVIEDRVRLVTRPFRAGPLAIGDAGSAAPVALFTASLGDDGRILPRLPELGYRGLVVEAMGAGHVPDVLVAPLSELAAQMPVVLATRVASGPVFTRTYDFPGSEMDLLRHGLVHGGGIGGLKARLLLSLLLGSGVEAREIPAAFARYAGRYEN